MKCSNGFGSRPQRNEVLTSLAQLYQIRFSADLGKDPISRVRRLGEEKGTSKL